MLPCPVPFPEPLPLLSVPFTFATLIPSFAQSDPIVPIKITKISRRNGGNLKLVGKKGKEKS